ncbi:MAG: HEPN domain-containing protein [Chitinispirillales bacterium]|jgi:HEPN domain-containing protein|nr:HEPN domain-containing protein [Chitinispirillales bacterium]
MKNSTKGWIFFAENDMMLVESSIDISRLTGQVIFHSQQAIEKYFKSYLIENDIIFPKTHDLPTLYELVKKIKDFSIDEIMLEHISNIYTATRYPNNIGLLPDGQVPTMEKSKEVSDFAKNVENIIKKELGA